MTRTDVKILKRGLKRVALALLTTATLLLALMGFFVTALMPGYLAVALFLVSVVLTAIAYCLLYGHGMNHKTAAESKGERK